MSEPKVTPETLRAISSILDSAYLEAGNEDAERALTDAVDALAAAADRIDQCESALTKIDAIRNDIVGRQTIGWSAHVYPLVAALGDAGYPGEGYDVARAKAVALISEVKRLEKELAAERAKVATMEAEREIVSEARAEVVTVEEQLAVERVKMVRLREAIEQACRMLPGETDVWSVLDAAIQQRPMKSSAP
jgi:hypothetical protein